MSSRFNSTLVIQKSVLNGLIGFSMDSLVNEFLRLKIPWKDHVGFLFDASEFSKLAFERDFLFGPANDRPC